jgi:uncharacterized protein DUF4129
VAVLVLLALVAVVSRAPRPDGALGGPAIDARSISVNVLFPFLVVAGIASALVGVSIRRRRGGRAHRPYNFASFASDVIAFATLVVFLRILVWVFHRRQSGLARPLRDPSALVTPTTAPGAAGASAVAGDWRIQLVVALLTAIAIGFLAFRFFGRVVREEPRRASPGAELAEVFDETLDALRSERDPRRAVIAAYARMERALGAAGLPRRASEAPAEYLARVLGAMRVSEPPVVRLTDLFERAKFDRRAVDEDMREQAISSLIAIREELWAVVS